MNRNSTPIATNRIKATGASYQIARAVIIAILIIFASAVQTHAQSNVGVDPNPRITFLSSPRAMAMGGCAANLAFYQSGLQNPATLGVFHLDRTFSASLSRSDRGYPFPYDDYRLKSASVSVGASLKASGSETKNRLKASVAVSYVKPTNDIDLYVTSYEHAGHSDRKSTFAIADETIAIGGCVEYIVRLGLGRRFAEQRDATGIILELPLATDLAWLNHSSDSGNLPCRLEITPSLAYVRLDDEQSKPYHIADRHFETYGFSLYGGMFQDINELGSFRFSCEKETGKIFQAGDIDKIGAEIGFLGMIFLRAGSYDAQYVDVANHTYGVGFSLHGLLTWLNRWGVINPSGDHMKYLVKHIDITVDYSWYNRNSDLLDNTNFIGVGISL